MEKTKDEKIKEQIKLIRDSCASWITEVDSIGNQCAYTDRMIEDILEAALNLSGIYNENIIYIVERYKNQDLYEDGIWTRRLEFRDYDKAVNNFLKMTEKNKTGLIVLSWSEKDTEFQHIIRERR